MKRLVFVLGAMALLCACAFTSRNLDARDDGRLYPLLRGGKQLLPRDVPEAADSNKAAGDFRFALRAEGEVTGTRGSVLPDDPFFGYTEYEMYEINATAQPGVANDQLRLHGIVGLGYHHFELESAGAGPRTADRGGFRIGVEAGWKPWAPIELYGRFAHTVLIYDGGSTRTELGLHCMPTDKLVLTAAWQTWRYRLENWNYLVNDLDVDLKTDGLLLGLEIWF